MSVLNHVLDLAKVTSGKLQLEQVEFGTQQWVEDSVAVHRQEALEKGLQGEALTPLTGFDFGCAQRKELYGCTLTGLRVKAVQGEATR